LSSANDQAAQLRDRTKRFALDVVRLVEKLPDRGFADVAKKQIMRSATSVGANYRSACRARSKADFLSKIRISLEEADETQYWLELLFESQLIDPDAFSRFHREADELISIFAASAKTAQRTAHTKRV
jgi:four helix bundle protein